CLLTRPERRRFPIALAVRQIDVEHVDLVVAGHDLALGPEQEAAVGATLRIELDGERADQQPGAEFGSQGLKSRDCRVAILAMRASQDLVTLGLDAGGVLGRQYEIGAGLASVSHQPRRRFDVFRDLPAGIQLDAGDRKRLAHDATRSEVSLPARSRAWSSSQPPMCRSSMKI